MADLEYNGTILNWAKNGAKKYPASSGMDQGTNNSGNVVDLRVAKYQTVAGMGPVPEGQYFIHLKLNGAANVVNKYTDPPTEASCSIAASKSGGVEKIPTQGPGECALYQYPGWGKNRIRMFKGPGNRTARSNFYLHDSTKGYSHGCIEVDGQFFVDLKAYIASHEDDVLTVKVAYPGAEASTNGGTKK